MSPLSQQQQLNHILKNKNQLSQETLKLLDQKTGPKTPTIFTNNNKTNNSNNKSTPKPLKLKAKNSLKINLIIIQA